MNEKTRNYYDTLLFQMDSDRDYVMWGDSGAANVFISSEALKTVILAVSGIAGIVPDEKYKNTKKHTLQK